MYYIHPFSKKIKKQCYFQYQSRKFVSLISCAAQTIMRIKLPKNLFFICLSIVLITIINSKFAFAQDFHFSQYGQTPVLVNPALTGAAHNLRASVIYKDQWRGITVPYKTSGASFEMKFKANNWEKVDQHKTKAYKKSVSRLAGGLSFFNDKAGDGNMGTTQVSLSLATFIPINGKHLLSAGIQTSAVQKSVDFSKLIFPEQFNGISYDPASYNGETNMVQSYTFADVASGVNWSFSTTETSMGANNTMKGNFGVALYHINKPAQKFLFSPNDHLYRKLVLHGELNIGIPGTNMNIIPNYLFQFQGPSKEFIIGLMTKYHFKEDSKYTGFIKRSSVAFGAAYRTGDALIISSLLEVGQYAVGFSYDLNISKLTQASIGRGGPEIFLRFVTPNPFLYQMGNSKSRYNLN